MDHVDAVDRGDRFDIGEPSTVSIIHTTNVESLSAGTACVSGTARKSKFG